MNPAQQETTDTLFLDTVRTMRRGTATGAISAAMREVVEAVKATGKAGGFTLKFVIAPTSAEAVTVQVDYELTKKEPKAKTSPTLFFVNDDGGLQRHDPRQEEINFGPKPLPSPAAPAPASAAAAAQ